MGSNNGTSCRSQRDNYNLDNYFYDDCRLVQFYWAFITYELSGWAAWGEWTSCTLTCGSGTRTRLRKHATTGAEESEEAACNTDSCRKFLTNSRFFCIFLVEWSKILWVWIENFNFSKWILACDLYSLTCGVLFGQLILNSTCYSTKSYASLGDVYVYVTANSRLD